MQLGAGGGAIERDEGRERVVGLEMGEGKGADLRRGWCAGLKKGDAQGVAWGREGGREGTACLVNEGRAPSLGTPNNTKWMGVVLRRAGSYIC